jgi:hypothetical protein
MTKKALYAIAVATAHAPKPARVRRKPAKARKAKPSPYVELYPEPVSVNPAYTPRDVTTQDRATLRGGVYFVQCAPSAPWEVARWNRQAQTFHVHEREVRPLRVFTCDKDDFGAIYTGRGVENPASLASVPFARVLI